MAEYKLDRNAFKGQTASEAAERASYYQKLDWRERMRIAAYLNSEAYNYDPQNPPRMEKTVFKARSRGAHG